VRQRHALHHWSLEHSSSCALEGIVKGAARCASCPASELWFMCQRLLRGKVLRRRASEVREWTSYHRCGAERATVVHSTTRIVKVAARCACRVASELPLVCRQLTHGRVPRRRASEAHKLTGYHEVALDVRRSLSLHHWSFEHGRSGILGGIVRFAAHCSSCSASGSLSGASS